MVPLNGLKDLVYLNEISTSVRVLYICGLKLRFIQVLSVLIILKHNVVGKFLCKLLIILFVRLEFIPDFTLVQTFRNNRFCCWVIIFYLWWFHTFILFLFLHISTLYLLLTFAYLIWLYLFIAVGRGNNYFHPILKHKQ